MNTTSKVLSLRMNTEDYIFFQNLAKKDELPTSYIIRKVLKDYVRLHKTGKNEAQSVTEDINNTTSEDNVLNDWD